MPLDDEELEKENTRLRKELIDALNTINRNDLVELKSLANPAQMVKDGISQVVFLVYNKKDHPDWNECKKFLGDPAAAITKIQAFDPATISKA